MMLGSRRSVGCLPPPGAPPEGALWGSVMTAGAVVRPGLVRQAGRVSSTRRPRRRTLGLRARVTVPFALAGLVLAAGLALLTYSLARRSSANQREDVASRQAFVNARLVRDAAARRAAEPQRRSSARSGPRAAASPSSTNATTAGSAEQPVRLSDLPASLRRRVLDGDTGRQRFDFDGEPYLAVGVYVAEIDAPYFEVFPIAPLAHPAGRRRLAHARQRDRPPSSPPRSAGRPAAACCDRCPGWPTRPASWPRAASTPASSPSPTPTSTGWSARSTTWPTPCRTGSSVRPGSPPTSATSCAPPSPRSRPRSRCSTGAATTCPSAPRRRSTSSSARCSASTRWCSTSSRSPGSTPASTSSTSSRSCSADFVRAIAARYGYCDVPVDVSRRSERPSHRQAPPGRADRRQPPRERREPRRRPVAHRPRGRRRRHGAPRRRGRRAGRAAGRARPASSSASPAARRPATASAPASAWPSWASTPGHGRPGVGRGPPGRRRPLRRLAPRGPGMRPVRGGRRRALGRPTRGSCPGRLGVAIAVALAPGPAACRRRPRRARSIGPDVPFGLADTSTTSTTTTVPEPTADHDGRSPATTVPGEPVKIYLVQGGNLVAVERAIPVEAGPLPTCIAACRIGPSRGRAAAPGCAPPIAVRRSPSSASASGGTATVDVAPTFLERSRRRRAAAGRRADRHDPHRPRARASAGCRFTVGGDRGARAARWDGSAPRQRPTSRCRATTTLRWSLAPLTG